MKPIKAISWTFAARVLSFMINMALVPATIRYMGVDGYGVWLSLFSLVTGWLIVDFGIGSAVRNLVVAAKVRGNDLAIREFVSTSLLLLTLLAIVSLILLFLILHLFGESSFLKSMEHWKGKPSEYFEIGTMILIFAIIMSFNFVLRITSSLMYAYHDAITPQLLGLIANAVTLLQLYFFTTPNNGTILGMLIMTAVPLNVVVILQTIMFFHGAGKDIKPRIGNITFKSARELYSKGIPFFVLQFEGMIIVQGAIFIASLYFTPGEISVHNVVMRYFSIMLLGISIVMNAYWAPLHEATINRNNILIKKIINRGFYLFLAGCLFSIILLIYSDEAYLKWLKGMIHVEKIVSISAFLHIVVASWVIFIEHVIQGLGKVRTLYKYSILTVVLFLPVFHMLASYFNLGIESLFLAILIVTLPKAIYATIVCISTYNSIRQK